MLDDIDFFRLFGLLLVSPEAPWDKRGTSKYIADVEREQAERQVVIDIMMRRYEAERAAKNHGG